MRLFDDQSPARALATVRGRKTTLIDGIDLE
jgi:hypothetical protein